jgi:dihydrofolate synthase/folylpolyglutamate synthase
VNLETLRALYARVPLGMRLGLAPMLEACARAGHPERAFAAVHIGGTNGKGSTSAMVESIARAAGLRTGLYTSPHLCRFAERIRLDGEPLDDAASTRVMERALRAGPDLSFFETATLAAFLAFREANVELAVIEVGIGGRLDATNVLEAPRCTVITSVAFDHQDKLGDTLDAIAREKAAIAKRGVPLVLGRMSAEARDAAVAVAKAAGAKVVQPIPLPAGTVVGLGGAHQRENAAIAWTSAALLGLPAEAIAKGLAAVRWPGRLEAIDIADGPLAGPWILDGAHNPDGMEALVRALDGKGVGALVFGALSDKPWREMLEGLGSISAPRVYVAPSGRLPADPAQVAGVLPGAAAVSVDAALMQARALAGARPVVVCGSLYLVGEARAKLLGLPLDPIVAL